MDNLVLASKWLEGCDDAGAWISGSHVIVSYDSMYTVWQRYPAEKLFHGSARSTGEYLDKLFAGAEFTYGESYHGYY